MSPLERWWRRRAPVSEPARLPALHRDGTDNWGLEPAVLAFLEQHTTAATVSLETGAGMSTLVLARKGGLHHVITPSADEIDRIRAECAAAGIDTSRVTFMQGLSQNILPTLALPSLDLAIIDGGHGMPVPFVDWCFLAPALKVGGILIVDDTQVWTGATLCDFLRAEWQWETLETFRKAVAFRKVAEPVFRDWSGQPFVAARSSVPSGWPWWNNALHGHVAGLDAVLEEIEALGDRNADSIVDLQWVEGELLDCVRRIEGICAAKSRRK